MYPVTPVTRTQPALAAGQTLDRDGAVGGGSSGLLGLLGHYVQSRQSRTQPHLVARRSRCPPMRVVTWWHGGRASVRIPTRPPAALTPPGPAAPCSSKASTRTPRACSWPPASRSHREARPRRGRARRPALRRPAARASAPAPRCTRDGARRRARPARGRRLLHRHEPDRPGRRGGARRRRLQRALLQHPQRRRARARRDHLADPPADREERPRCTPASGTSRPRQPRGARPQARHRRLRQHRQPALGASPRRWACACSSTTPPTSSPLGNARAAHRSTSCSRRPTSSRCTSTAGRATPASSARSSSPGCGPARCSSTSRRGFVVDHDALRRHIESGHIAGAAIDVFPNEPGRGRRVRVPAARAAERHPHAAHRRLHRGGAAGHRHLRRGQAARLRRERHTALGQHAAAGAAARSPARAGCCTCTATSRASSPRSTAAGRARGQHRGPAAGDPRPARLLADGHPGRLRAGRRP